MATESEFMAWYDRYADKLFRHCLYRVFDRELAQELTQQAFLKAWEYLSRGSHIDHPQAFLYKTLTHLIIDEREKKHTVSLDVILEENQEPTEDSEEQFMLDIEAAEVIKTMQTLDPLYKEVLLLRYVDELKPKEIAEVLGETQNVISVRIHRAKAQLKERLHQHTRL